jgi:hypothetical protein
VTALAQICDVKGACRKNEDYPPEANVIPVYFKANSQTLKPNTLWGSLAA